MSFCKKIFCCFSCCKCCKKYQYFDEIDSTTRLLPVRENTENKSLETKMILFGKKITETSNEMIEISKITKKAIKKIVIGDEHLLVLFVDGTLFGMGKNNLGQLGFPLLNDNNTYSDLKQIFLPKEMISKLGGGKYEIIDIAAADTFSILIILVNNFTYIIRFGICDSDKYKDDIKEIKTIVRYFKINIAFGKL